LGRDEGLRREAFTGEAGLEGEAFTGEAGLEGEEFPGEEFPEASAEEPSVCGGIHIYIPYLKYILQKK
jgi:hypothetical protein